MRILREPTMASELSEMSRKQFGSFVKAVVDVRRGIMAVGCELHADCEAALLEDRSLPGDLWGINIHPEKSHAERIEFHSLINVRPSQGNRSRSVEDPAIREKIQAIVRKLVQ